MFKRSGDHLDNTSLKSRVDENEVNKDGCEREGNIEQAKMEIDLGDWMNFLRQAFRATSSILRSIMKTRVVEFGEDCAVYW